MEERLVLTVEEAGRKLGLARQTAYSAIHTGQLPHIRIGRRILVPSASLDRLLAQADNPKVG